MRLKLLQLWLSCQQKNEGTGEDGKGVKEKGDEEMPQLEKGKGQGKDTLSFTLPFPFCRVRLLLFLRGFTFQQGPASRQKRGSQQDLDNVAGNVLQINQEGH